MKPCEISGEHWAKPPRYICKWCNRTLVFNSRRLKEVIRVVIEDMKSRLK